MTTDSADRSPRTTARVAATALAVIIAAIVPALAGLVLLGSAARRRPMLGRRIFPNAHGAPGPATTAPSGRLATRLTLAWGAGLLVTGLVQGLMALTADTSITDPAGMLTRTLVGLAGEALLALATLGWLRRLHADASTRHTPRAPLAPADVPVSAPAPHPEPADASGHRAG